MTEIDLKIVDLFFIILVISYLFTIFVIKLLRLINAYDVPNQRSSHSLPILRGGGISIVLIGVISNFIFFVDSLIHIKLIIVPILLAMTAFYDDISGISTKYKIIIQLSLSLLDFFSLVFF